MGKIHKLLTNLKHYQKKERKNMVKMAVDGNWLHGLNENEIALLIDNI